MSIERTNWNVLKNFLWQISQQIGSNQIKIFFGNDFDCYDSDYDDNNDIQNMKMLNKLAFSILESPIKSAKVHLIGEIVKWRKDSWVLNAQTPMF